MGYTTEFEGVFKINTPVDKKTKQILIGLNKTRRMKRDVDEEKYGVEGEFYFNHDGDYGQTHEENIIDYNSPPSTQPGLWCQWELQEDDQTICWDGREKFYNYIEWIQYIIDRVLVPAGYYLSGEVIWQGEDRSDTGKIIIENRADKDHVIKIEHGHIVYS